MLHTLCASCKQPLPFDRIASWRGADPLCGADCEAAHAAASPPVPGPEALTSRARYVLTRARRSNEQLRALEALADDRRIAASKIIGITKGARRRKARLEDEANEFGGRADERRFELESRLTELMGYLMALREAQPDLVAPAVGLVNGFPSNAGQADADRGLATIEGLLTGARATTLRRGLVEEGSKRGERHHDAFCVYESQRLEAGGEAIWTQEQLAEWRDVRMVEHIDRSVELHGAGGVLASLGVTDENRATIFDWLRQERPDLRDAQRSMTAFEAMSIPGCLLLVVLGVGGALTGALAFFDVATLWVVLIGGLTAISALIPVGWAVRRLVNRPVVLQLVGSESGEVAAALPIAAPGAVHSE